MFDNLTYKQRNDILKKSLKDQTIVIFPKDEFNSMDGVPNMAIIYTDLKEAVIDKDKKKARAQKNKAKTDVGAVKRKKAQEEEGKTSGSVSNAKSFRNNSHLFMHMNDFELSMLNEQVTKSKSINFRRGNKNQGPFATEDFGIKLGDAKKEKDPDELSDEEEKAKRANEKNMDKVNIVTQLFGNLQATQKKARWGALTGKIA